MGAKQAGGQRPPSMTKNYEKKNLLNNWISFQDCIENY